MSAGYLLPCPVCGASFRVTRGDAGARLTCKCGADVAVPPLRKLTLLPPDATTPETRAAAARPWGPRERWSLVGGGLLAIGLASVVVLGRSTPAPPGVATVLDARDPDDVSSYRLVETYRLWAVLRQGPTASMNRLAAYEFERSYRAHLRLRTIAWATAGAGLLMALAARCCLPKSAATP